MRKRRCPTERGLPLIPLPHTRASDHPVRPFHCLTYFLQKASPREQGGSSALYNRKQPSATQTALFRGHASCPAVPGLAGSWFPDSPPSGFPNIYEAQRTGEEIHSLDS